MHIAANIDDCAIIIDEFLNKDFFKEISSFNYSKLKSHTSHEKWEDKGVKAAATRARKALGELGKLSKHRRAEIQDKKNSM